MTRMIAAGKGGRGGNWSEYQFRAKVTVDPEPNGSSSTGPANRSSPRDFYYPRVRNAQSSATGLPHTRNLMFASHLLTMSADVR